MHWIVILIGIIILSASLSNPFYKLLVNKGLNLSVNKYLALLVRFILLLLAIIVIFTGLYLESI